MTHLKTIKCPKIKNSELLDGVSQVSQSIEGCIKLAENALGSSTSQQNPEVLNPPKKRSGDMLLGIDRMNSKLADCIKITESTLQNKCRKQEKESAGDLVRQTPSLFGWHRLFPGYLRALHRNLLTLGLRNQSSPSSIRTLITS